MKKRDFQDFFFTNLARSAISWLAENRVPALLADWELRRFLIRELLLGIMLLLNKLLLLEEDEGGGVRMRRWTRGLLSWACSWLSSTLWVASIKLSLPGDIPRLKLRKSLYFVEVWNLITENSFPSQKENFYKESCSQGSNESGGGHIFV